MNRFLTRANKRVGWGGAAVLLISTALTGQILGFLRTKLVNANFSLHGAYSTDIYFAAFKIPDFFFYTLAAGALGVAFIPVLADRLEKGDKKAVWEISASLMNLLLIMTAAVAVIIFVFAKPLMHYIVAPEMTPAQLDHAAMLMRFLALNPLLFTMSGIVTAMQQTFGRFFFYAIAPLFYNLSIIASIYIFRGTSLNIVGLGIGALVGAVLQLLVVLLGMPGLGFRYHRRILWKSGDFRKILKQLPPRSLDQGIDSINSIIETNFARRLGTGYISYYENAYILQTAPILLIGATISTAAFPRLTGRLSQHRPDLFRKDFLKVLRVLIWIAAPVAVVSYFSRGYLARLIFSRGSIDIAAVFGFLAGAIFFRIIYSIISRYYYAQKDTITPLIVSLFAIALNIVLAYYLSQPTAYGVNGLAMAESIVAATEVIILTTIMVIRDHRVFSFDFIKACIQILSVTGFSIMTAYVMVSFLPLGATDRGIITLGSKLGAIVLATFIVHFGVSWLFGLEEVKPVLQKIRKIILKPVRIDF